MKKIAKQGFLVKNYMCRLLIPVPKIPCLAMSDLLKFLINLS